MYVRRNNKQAHKSLVAALTFKLQTNCNLDIKLQQGFLTLQIFTAKFECNIKAKLPT